MVIRKRVRRSGAALTVHKVYELCTGEVNDPNWYRYTGYSTDGSADIEQYIHDIKRDWARYGKELIPWLVRGAGETMRPAFLGRPGPAPWDLFSCSYPGTRPWAWWRLDAPEPRRSESQFEYLQRLNLLLPSEEEACIRYAAKRRAEEIETIIYQAEQALGVKSDSMRGKHSDLQAVVRQLESAKAEMADFTQLFKKIGLRERGYWDDLD